MARLTLLTIALAFLYALNFVKCETWGDVDGKLELNNIGVGSAATDGKNQVNLTKIVEGTEGTNSVRGIQVSPRFLLQPRIDAAPTTRTTITYKLGQRINGKCYDSEEKMNGKRRIKEKKKKKKREKMKKRGKKMKKEEKIKRKRKKVKIN